MAIALLSLLIPFLAQGGSVVGGAGSVTARAAQNVDTPGNELFPQDGPVFATAQRLAVEHWGADACGGEVVTRWADLDPGTNATASWRNPIGRVEQRRRELRLHASSSTRRPTTTSRSSAPCWPTSSATCSATRTPTPTAC